MTRHHWHEKNGDMIVVEDHEETPKGYIDTHPDNLKLINESKGGSPVRQRPVDIPIKDQTGGSIEGEDAPLKREQIVNALTLGGFEVNTRSKTDVLEKQLHTALSEVLIAKGITNVDLMSTRQMMVAMELIVK